jgi:hypothetical protein
VTEPIAAAAANYCEQERFCETATESELSMRITRRGIQIALAVLWLIDGALQLQPFMFGHGFADQIIAPAGQGQPGFVASAVSWAARVINAHPAAWDSLFAVVQLGIGLALLIRRAARVALAASVAWALGVWYLGEGLGGLASGHADLLTGAPGAVLLYAVLAIAAWPTPAIPAETGLRRLGRLRTHLSRAAWLPAAWAVLWVGAALLRALPGQNSSPDLSAEIRAHADGAPGWLAHLDRAIAGDVASHPVIAALVIVEAIIGLAALRPGLSRDIACYAGILVSIAFWVVGQSFGQLYSGQATDPNTAPLIALFAIAVLGLPDQPDHPVARAKPEPTHENQPA